MAGMRITHFGGLLPRVHPQNLQVAMAQECVDADLSAGTLKPFRTDRKIGDETARAFYTDGCCVMAAENCRASFARMWGGCEWLAVTGLEEWPAIARAEDACAGRWCRMGLPDDVPAPNVQALGAHEGNFNSEARRYVYTLNNEWGEGLPSPVSELLLCHNDNDVVVSNIPTVFDGGWCVRSVRIYCAVSGLDYGAEGKGLSADFLLVGEIPAGTGVFVHKAHTLYGEACVSQEYAPPPPQMHSLQYCGNGQFGGIVGEELWLSEPRLPNAWPEAFRYGNFRGRLVRFLCGERAGYVLTDQYPALIETESPCRSQGCRSVRVLEEVLPIVSYPSAALYNGACVYASRDGLVMLAGGEAQVVSAGFFTPAQWQALMPWTLRGVVHDGWYFGTTDRLSFRFRLPDAVHGQAEWESLTHLSLRARAWFRGENDRLFYAAEDGGIFEWNAGDDWREFFWRGRLNVLQGRTVLSAYKVVGDFAPVRVLHTGYRHHRGERVAEAVVLGDKVVADNRPHRLKAGYAVLEVDVCLSGRGEVREYHVAAAVSDLGGL